VSSSSRRRTIYGLAAVVVAVAAFALALVPRIPLDPVLRPLLVEVAAEAGLDVRYDRSRLRWYGIALTDVEIATVGSLDPADALRVSRLDVRPSLRGVISGRRGAPWVGHAQLYGGSARLALDVQGPHWTADLEWAGIDLSRLPAPSVDVRVLGASDGRLSLSTPGGETPETTGTWNVSGHHLQAAGLRSGRMLLPPLDVTHLETEGSWEGRRLTVDRLAADGPFGELALSGRIMLREPIEKSALGLALVHRPAAQMPPDLALALRLLLPPGRAGEAQHYTLRGTLAAPTITAGGS
jgi:type II secretion system protein N